MPPPVTSSARPAGSASGSGASARRWRGPPSSIASSPPGDPMTDAPIRKLDDMPDSTQDEQLDEILRMVAHAPRQRPPPEPAHPGDRWGAEGRYVIEELIGRGGMGTVYSAADALLHRTVALKVLDPGRGDDEEAHRARLMRE